ncbi:hypothetical protein [Buchnera aphidicola]
MKFFGKVMAIERKFQESIQKTIQGLEIESGGFDSKINKNDMKNLEKIKYELKYPGSERLWYTADVIRIGLSISQIHKLTSIDKWYLSQIQDIITIEKIQSTSIYNIDNEFFKEIKKRFSNKKIAILMHESEDNIHSIRYNLNLHPVYKKIDTCSTEFHTETLYMYSTW